MDSKRTTGYERVEPMFGTDPPPSRVMNGLIYLTNDPGSQQDPLRMKNILLVYVREYAIV